MDATQARSLRELLTAQQVAALATLHNGAPAVSMVPYALLPEGAGFVLHVSRLATHTADMLASPAVALLVAAPAGSAATPQETPRASIVGEALPCGEDAPGHAAARDAYLARFPHSEQTFAFADFCLFVVSVRSVRFVGGFANATSVLAERFRQVMR